MTTGTVRGGNAYPDDGVGFDNVAGLFEGGGYSVPEQRGPQARMSARDYFAGLASLAQSQDAWHLEKAKREAADEEQRRRNAAEKRRVDSAADRLFAAYVETTPERMWEHVDVLGVYDELVAEPSGLKWAQRERTTDAGHAAAVFAAASTTHESGEPFWPGGSYAHNARLAGEYLLAACGHPDSHIGPYRAPHGILSLTDEALTRIPADNPANITQENLNAQGYYDSLPIIPRTFHPVAAILAADALHQPTAMPLKGDEWLHVAKTVAYAARDRYGYAPPANLVQGKIDLRRPVAPRELEMLAEIIAAEAHDLPNASQELYGHLARRVHRTAYNTQVNASALPQRARGTFEQLLRYHREHRFDVAREYFRRIGSNVREFVSDPAGWLGLPSGTTVDRES